MDAVSNSLDHEKGWGRGLYKVTILIVIIALMLLSAGQPQIVYAASFTVTTTDDELNADGDCSLREAIQAANTDSAVDACLAGSGPDTITVPAGAYILSLAGADEDANGTGDLDITSDMRILGSSAATTIIDGATLDGVLTIHGGVAQIIGVTIRNGGNTPGFGGIANWSDLILTEVSVESNAAGHGGGIRNGGTLAIYNSTIKDNTAIFKGGAIFNDPGGIITINHGAINGNTAEGAAGINNEGTLTIIDSTLNENSTSDAGLGLGGAIGNAGLLIVEGSTFMGNSAQNGAAIFNGGDTTISDTSFTGNTSTCCGGAITNNAFMTIEGSTFSDNSSVAGAAINNFGGDLKLTDVNLTNNIAENGGGVFNMNSGIVSITHSTIRENSATNGGGGIINHQEDSLITIEASTITGNTAGFRGGGILNDTGSILRIDGSTLSENQALSNVWGYGQGGAVSNYGVFTIKNSTVSSNRAKGYGGAIMNETGGTVQIEQSTLVGNQVLDSLDGPGLGGAVRNDGTLTIMNSNITANNAFGYGGGIHNSNSVVLINSVVTGNSTTLGVGSGGGVFNDGGSVTLTKSKVRGNRPDNCVGC